MEKICSKCKENKDISEFRKKSETTYIAHCKSCHKIYINNHYKNNKEYYKNKGKRNDAIYKKRYSDYKRSLKCFDCDFSFKDYPNVCDFHHIEDNKEINPSQLATWNWSKFKVEVDKCIPLCANCHRIRHSTP